MTGLGLLLAAALAAPAPADTAPRPISLAEAVALAQRNAPAIVQAEGSARTSKAAMRAAWSAFIPSLSLSAGANRQVPALPNQTRTINGQVVTLSSQPWSYSTGLGASVELFDGGRRFFDLGQARAQSVGADAGLVTQRFAATLAVQEQYFAVLAARESEAAAQAQLDQADQQLRVSVLRLRQRVVTRSDSLRSEIQVHNARVAVLQARTGLDQANAALTRAVGAPGLVTAAPEDTLERGGLALPDDQIRSLALEGPPVRQASATLDATRAALRSSWTGYLPSLSMSYSASGSAASAGFTLANDYGYTGGVRLSLSFPLFDQWQRASQTVQAQVSRDNAEAQLRDARLAALGNLTEWLGTWHSAEERVAMQDATVRAAEEDLREQQQKYAIGLSTLVDVLTSQTTLVQARHDLIQARFDRRVAKAQLEALVGRSL